MLELFENLDIPEEKLHDKYKLLRDDLRFTGEQNILVDWVRGFEDRDNKIVKEFQTTFHSTFWELYLFAVFKEAGFVIDFSKNRPDFIITSPQKIYVEAVVANIKQQGKQENQRTQDDIISMAQPVWEQEDFDESLHEAITRYSNSINKKSEKYHDYINDYGFDNNAPYLVAVAGFDQINYGNNFYYAMIALLYGKYFDNLNQTYSPKQNITKPNTENTIPLGLFLNDEYSHISAIVFTCTLTLGKLTSLVSSQKKPHFQTNEVICIKHDALDPPHYKPQIVSADSPEYLSDSLFIFHNPFATTPLNDEYFSSTNVINVHFKDNILSMEGNNCPIVSRLNLLRGLGRLAIPDIIKNFNLDYEFITASVSEISKVDLGNWEVKFFESLDNIEFILSIDSENFTKYKIEENKDYMIEFSPHQPFKFESKNQVKQYVKIKKLSCLTKVIESTIINIKLLD